jgi:hypothetical protein
MKFASTPFTRLLSVCAALLLLTSACAGDEIKDPAPSTTNNGVNNGSMNNGSMNNGSMNNGQNNGMSCDGCMTARGFCDPGKTATACGAGGGLCKACQGGQDCDDSGQCVDPPECTPANCTGCCDAAGKCQTGKNPMACGATGLGCEKCPEGASCPEGACVLPCGPDNCTGCCDATGQCQNGDVDTVCGKGGEACGDCSTNDQVCAIGVCIAKVCAETCTGCCDSGGNCIMNTDDAMCGKEGNACEQCGTGKTCEMGACAAAAGSLWNVVVVNGEVAPKKPDDSSWDAFGGLPDPYVVAKVTDPLTGDEFEGETDNGSGTLNPEWNETVLMGITEGVLLNGITFEYWDDDLASDDEICTVVVQPDMTTFSAQIVESTCDTDAASKFRWRFEAAN